MVAPSAQTDLALTQFLSCGSLRELQEERQFCHKTFRFFYDGKFSLQSFSPRITRLFPLRFHPHADILPVREVLGSLPNAFYFVGARKHGEITGLQRSCRERNASL